MQLVHVFTALTVAALHASPLAQQREAAQKSDYAKLTDSAVLLTDGNPTKAKLADCQPMKGERVQVVERKANVDGMQGASAARVVVVEGACAGQEGWVGLPRLEKATAPSAQ